MKKFILLLFLVFLTFVVLNRQKLYVRDPLGSVTRNGAKEAGAQVYINYSNEVLLQNETPPVYSTLLQANNHAGIPIVLKCVHWMACLTDADPAGIYPPATPIIVNQMTNREVDFTDDKGQTVVVTLR